MRFDPQSAESDALRDWKSKRCKRLVVGLVSNDPYPINRKCGLNTMAIGEHFPTRNEHLAAQQYCLIYNETVDKLIAQHGIPDWADVYRRKSDRKRMLELIVGNLYPRSELETVIDIKKHRVYQLTNWTWDAIAFADLPTEGLSFMVGDRSPRCGRVDMFDSSIRPGKLLASELYRRRHFPHLPWDEIARRVSR